VTKPKSTIFPLVEPPLHRESKSNKGNPHPNTVGLQRGGRKKGSGRQITSQQEDIFCFLLKLGRGKSEQGSRRGSRFCPERSL
jgi:hypothetical protein